MIIRTARKMVFSAAILAIAAFLPCACFQGAGSSVCTDDGGDLDPTWRAVGLEHLWMYETGG
ncbi:MAG TPA: hypothetical protein VMX58_09100 [Patescibacteria group bacterium]|nr:hypothetical protein [Patescibacteria group bacterium]